MSKRIDKVNELIKQTISTLLLKEGYFEKDILVTVTQVKTAPNFSQTSVFISAIPEEKFDLVIKVLNKNIYDLQQKLNKKLVMKRVPKIIFQQETKTKEADRIEKLLDRLKKERKKDIVQNEE